MIKGQSLKRVGFTAVVLVVGIFLSSQLGWAEGLYPWLQADEGRLPAVDFPAMQTPAEFSAGGELKKEGSATSLEPEKEPPLSTEISEQTEDRAQDALKTEKDNLKDSLPQPEETQASITLKDIPIALGQDIQLREQNEDKVSLEDVGADRIVELSHDAKGNVIIEYQGTTITIDSSVEIGKIEVGENGVRIYDKEGNLIGGINNDGSSYWKIKDSFVLFEKGVNLSIKGDSQGKTNYIEAETDAGKYTLKLDGNQLTITSPSEDTVTIDTSKFTPGILLGRFSKEGGAWISFYTKDYNQHIRVGFNSQGKIDKVRLSTRHTEQISPTSYRVTWESHEISLNSAEDVNLNLTANEDGSVTIASNVENSVQLKFNKDGSVEAIQPSGKVISIKGDVEKADFNKDGSLTITYKNGAKVTIDAQGYATIEYAGTTLKIDANLLGKIDINKNGSIYLYDKDGKYLGYITSQGWGRIWLGGRPGSGFGDMVNCVHFGAGTTLEIKSDEQGKIKSIKITTEAGDYLLEKTADGNIKVTTPGGDTFSYNINDVEGGDLYFKKDGSAWLDVWTKGWDKSIRVICDSTGKIVAVNNYRYYPDRNEISLDRNGNINLNLTVNEDGSVTIASDVENSVQLKFNKDGSAEAIKPDGTVIPMTGDINTVTFNEDGSLTIKFENGTILTISPDKEGWWSGKTVEEMINYLGTLAPEEAAKLLTELTEYNVNIAAKVIAGMNTKTAALILGKMDSKKQAEIFNAEGRYEFGLLTYIVSARKAANILSSMNPDKAAEVLSYIAEAMGMIEDFRLININGAQRAASILGAMDATRAAKIIASDNMDANTAARILENMNSGKVARILTATDRFKIRTRISSEKAAEILTAMSKEKAAEVLSSMEPKQAVPIIKAMLKNQGAETTAGILSLMAADDIAAIMAAKYRGIELSVDECVEILKVIENSDFRAEILNELYELNPDKAFQIAIRLLTGTTLDETSSRLLLEKCEWIGVR